VVGDDLSQDVLPAMRLGARGVLVRTGKFSQEQLQTGSPDHLLESIAAITKIISATA
jgi:ribonucleotide monophosphatase NagD (HAD superfamily)